MRAGKWKISNAVNADLTARMLIALADGLQLQSLMDTRINAAQDLEAAIAGLRKPL